METKWEKIKAEKRKNALHISNNTHTAYSSRVWRGDEEPSDYSEEAVECSCCGDGTAGGGCVGRDQGQPSHLRLLQAEGFQSLLAEWQSSGSI